MPTIERPDKPVSKKKDAGGNDALVTLWEHRLEMAERKLKKKGGDIKGGEWRDNIRFFEGEQWDVKGGRKGSFHKITANQIKSNVDSLRPQLYFQNPKVRIQVKNPSLAPQPIPAIDPQTGQPQMDPATGQPVIEIPAGAPIAIIGGRVVNAQEQVELLQAVDNYYLDEMAAKEIIRRITNDALVLPYGVAKIEWVVEFGEKEVEEIGQDGVPTLVKRDIVIDQYPKLTRVKPWCFLWDTELDEFNLDLADWVAEIKMVSKEDLESDDRLDIDWNDLKDTPYIHGEEYDATLAQLRGGRNTLPEDVKRYKVFEIHDLKNSNFYIWVEGSRKINRKEEPSYYENIEGSIYTLLGFAETIDDSFPLSLVSQIKSLVEGYNFMLSFAVNHAQRGNRKYKILEGTMSPDEVEKWERGADLTTIKVKDMAGGPFPIEDAPVPSDVYSVSNILKRETTESLGVTAYQRGSREAGVDTAFEASLIQGGSDVKVQEKRDIVREFVRRIVRKLNQVLKEYADTATVTRIAGLTGEKWVSWTSEDIKGEFIEDVDIYTSLPYSELEEKKQAMEMFSLAQMDPFFKPLELRQKVVQMMKWPEQILKSEAEVAAEQQAAQQQAEQQAQAQEQQRQQSQNLRPSGGDIRRRPDVVGGIRGQARKIG